jgi:hypothetical protein
VLNIGIELVLDQVWHVEIPDLLRFGISVGTILLVLAYAHFKPLQKLRFVLVWLAQGIGIVNEFVDWAFAPLRGLFNLLVKAVRRIPEQQAS